MGIDRRTLLGGSTGAAIASSVLAAPVVAQAQTSSSQGASQAAPEAPPEVTRSLARYIVAASYDDLPMGLRHEAARTLVNWVGCAIGGSREPATMKAVAALSPFSGPAEADLFGRAERFDILNAALINGIASHVLDYDDTHLKTIIHPAGPVAPAILALAQHRTVNGREFLNALVLGMETECRIGNAVYPEHYTMGWHITGSCGPFGAAAACGKLLGLNAQQMAWALGLAASQPVGLKIQFGSMTKSFHPGRAAQNGMLAALLAAQGYDADPAALEGKDGWGQALSTRHDWREVTDGLGSRYEAALNTYKPFACGVVAHPAIDAAIQLRNENRLTPTQIARVELRGHPLVLSLMGKTEPRTGLEGKFSIYHCVAVALVAGAAGEHQFSDSAVQDPVVAALRKRVTVIIDSTIAPEQADLTITLGDGRMLNRRIVHAVGSLENPLSDAALEAKFLDLTDGILAREQAQRVMALCWDTEKLADCGAIARAGAGR